MAENAICESDSMRDLRFVIIIMRTVNDMIGNPGLGKCDWNLLQRVIWFCDVLGFFSMNMSGNHIFRKPFEICMHLLSPQMAGTTGIRSCGK